MKNRDEMIRPGEATNDPPPPRYTRNDDLNIADRIAGNGPLDRSVAT